MKVDIDTSGNLSQHWCDWESFLKDCTGNTFMAEGARNNSCNSMEVNSGSGWHGTKTFAEAVSLASNGWPEGLARIKRLSSGLKPISGEKADRHIAKYAECGDEVDVGRFTTGEPECMVDWDIMQVPAAGRVVKLVLQMAVSAAFKEEDYFMRGAAAVMLADLIEQSDLRSEIVIACGISRGGNRSERTIIIKTPDQPLELDRVAFMLAHPAAFRRLMFRVMEQLSNEQFEQYHSSTYGTPQNVEMPGEGNIQVDALQYGFGNSLTSETLPQFVDKMLTKYLDKEEA